MKYNYPPYDRTTPVNNAKIMGVQIRYYNIVTPLIRSIYQNHHSESDISLFANLHPAEYTDCFGGNFNIAVFIPPVILALIIRGVFRHKGGLLYFIILLPPGV